MRRSAPDMNLERLRILRLGLDSWPAPHVSKAELGGPTMSNLKAATADTLCGEDQIVPAQLIHFREMKARTVFLLALTTASCTQYRVAPSDGGDTGLADSFGQDSADAGSERAESELAVRDGALESQPQALLGKLCLHDLDCESQHCAGSVCCDQACQGPCAECSSDGHCQMPADDPACGTISCPTDTPCRDWATSITANRCSSLGQCKTSSACSYLNAPAKTYCSLYMQMVDRAQVCDGQGNCSSPSVTCGADGECPVNPGVCCVSRNGSGTSCHAGDGSCDLTTTAPVLCDEAADCPPSFVCCYTGNLGGIQTVCAQTCPSTTFGVRLQVCNPRTPGECVSGTCQAAGSNAIGGPPFLCM
jgi:hypothetical protein